MYVGRATETYKNFGQWLSFSLDIVSYLGLIKDKIVIGPSMFKQFAPNSYMPFGHI